MTFFETSRSSGLNKGSKACCSISWLISWRERRIMGANLPDYFPFGIAMSNEISYLLPGENSKLARDRMLQRAGRNSKFNCFLMCVTLQQGMNKTCHKSISATDALHDVAKFMNRGCMQLFVSDQYTGIPLAARFPVFPES